MEEELYTSLNFEDYPPDDLMLDDWHNMDSLD